MKRHWLIGLGGLCLLACPTWADPPRGLFGGGKRTPGPYIPCPCPPTTPAPGTADGDQVSPPSVERAMCSWLPLLASSHSV